MNRLTGRATSWSVLLHGAVVALLVVRGSYEASEPSRLTIIDAELLLSGARSAAPGPVTENADRSPPDVVPHAEREEPAAAAEPEPAPPERDTSPEPETVATAEEVVEPPRESQPAAEPLAAEPPSAPATAEAAPAAPLPTDPEPDEPRAEATVAETQPSSSAVEPAAVEPRPGTPIAGREHAMLEKRFSAWTGKLDGARADTSVSWKDAGQEYTAVLRKLPADGAMGMERMVVEISTEQNGNRMSTEMRMARLAFSNFAQFVDRWDPDVQIHDDQIDGRFHSNTEINVTSLGKVAPVFNGRVTIASREINSEGLWRARRDRIFPEGLEMGVRRIMLPSELTPLGAGVNVDAEQVHHFERDARITFYADGTYGWQYLESPEPERTAALDHRSHYLIGTDDAALHIKGTVNGKLLVYTPERIVIEDDLLYADDPRTSDSDDYLGLVAERSVEIAPPNVTGDGDLIVQASIYARRQFAVRSYRSKESGTLIIYGSVTAGSLTATEPRFATHIQFDERLASARPPSFPLSDRYELESWDGEWRVEPLLPHPDADAADDRGYSSE